MIICSTYGGSVHECDADVKITSSHVWNEHFYAGMQQLRPLLNIKFSMDVMFPNNKM